MPEPSATTPPEESGRLVRWPRPGAKGEARALTFLDDPELVQALDQLSSAMAVAYHAGAEGRGERPATPASAGLKLLAVSRELSSLAGFLDEVRSEIPETAALAALARRKATELKAMVAELESAVVRGTSERPDD